MFNLIILIQTKYAIMNNEVTRKKKNNKIFKYHDWHAKTYLIFQLNLIELDIKTS